MPETPPERDPATALVHALRTHGATLATAESLTGGRLAARLTAVPGASHVYLGGIVSYATELKLALLGVPETLVATHGVVSAECARAMADGVRRLTGSAYALSTTGVAGPDAQEGKPPGVVFVGLATPDEVHAWELSLTGDRAAVQEATCDAAVDALGRVLATGGGALG